MTELTCDLCIVGAGSGGLSVAAAASQMGAKVILIEQGKMGGDCLNYGCVPSKSLIAAARQVQACRHAKSLGINAHTEVDYPAVQQHIKNVIGRIAPHDSIERFEGLGVTVIQATAKFISPKLLQAGDTTIKAKRFIIATGSSPSVPPIPGLEKVNYYTNETIFYLTELPRQLAIIGGGPIGCELAHAFALLGSKVELFEQATILPKDDPECVAIIRKQLKQDGVQLNEGIKIIAVKTSNNAIQINYECNNKQLTSTVSHLLIATGRKPNVETLDLAKANVNYDAHGIKVNRKLRSSNKNIYAIGDVIGELQFTHTANYHAGIVIKNILFKLPSKVSYQAMPWVTYTSPELAQVGLNETMAQKQAINYKVLRFMVAENDRAQTENIDSGVIKVLCDNKGRILGVSIVAKEAGDLLTPWILAINNNLKIKAMAEMVVPYPTLSEINKRVAAEFYKSFLTSKVVKMIVRVLLRFGF